MGEKIAAPLYCLVKQPHRPDFSNASFAAVGRLFVETLVYRRYQLSEWEVARTIRTVKEQGVDKFSINVLELMAVLITAYIKVVVSKGRLEEIGETVLMRGDNVSAVQ